MTDDAPPNATRIIISLPRSLLARIDDERYRRHIPSRAEAVRQLLETALTANPKDQSQ